MTHPQHDAHKRQPVGNNWLGRRSLAGRLFLLTSLATVLIMAAIAVVMTWNSHRVAVDTVQREINAALDGAQGSLHLTFASASSRGERILPVLERELGGIPVPDGTTEQSAAGDAVPVFKVKDVVLNGDISALMRVHGNTGADPAVIARVGTKWVRVATLLKDEQGKPRIYSIVDSKDLLAVTLDSGLPYNGLVQRNGKWYAMSILPLKDKSGAVYGGFSVRVSVDAEVQGLFESMSKMHVAQYGSLGVLQRTTDKSSWIPAAGDMLVGGLSDAERAHALQTIGTAQAGFASLDASDLGPAKYIAWSRVPGWDWIVYGAGDQASFLDESNRALSIQLALMLLGTLLISFLVWWVARYTIRPVRQVVDALDMLERGDLSADRPLVPERSNNEIHSLLAHLTRTQNGLERTITAVRTGVDEINLAATEIAAGNTDLSSRTEEQAASLQQTATSMEELAATVKQNTDHAHAANEVASAVSSVARRGEAPGSTSRQAAGALSVVAKNAKVRSWASAAEPL
ncbi:Cache 3/Cache 2 fusion domain-containing protein [Alcaligenaceae bacterium CGII-47]|nr:Cache 3/Cache 2 fusion domain-containing protein [Alcaligenaceae bacterium CGII-47]